MLPIWIFMAALAMAPHGAHHHRKHHAVKHSHKPEPSTAQPPLEAPPTAPEPAPAVPPVASAAGDPFHFELLSQPGPSSAPALSASQDEKLTRKVQSRRRILQAHQALGFVT